MSKIHVISSIIIIGFLVISGCTGVQPKPPIASCSCSPQSGAAPLQVSFMGAGSDPDGEGKELIYRWNFGDGEISAEKNPIHTYYSQGTYTAILTLTDKDGLTDTKSMYITVEKRNQQPTAYITVNPTQGFAPFTVQFYGSGSDLDGSITTYYWTFGDGKNSNTQNPSHTYTTPGTYTVVLTVTDDDNAQDTDSISITVNKKPNEPPTASLSANPISGDAPLTVTFTGSGTDVDGSIVGYYWTFGDGNSSSSQNPSHTYTNSGTYTVSFKVTDDDGATDTKQTTITVNSKGIIYQYSREISGIPNINCVGITYDGIYYYVIDTENKRVYQLDSELTWTGLSWNYRSHDHYKGFDYPQGITTFNGYVYVSGRDSELFITYDEIHKLDNNLSWKSSNEDELNDYVSGIRDIDTDGNHLYISQESDIIKKFQFDLKTYLGYFSISPYYPSSFAIHDQGDWLLVYDSSVGRIYRCKMNGLYDGFNAEFSNGRDIDLYGDTLIAVNGGKTVYFYNVNF